MVNEDELPWHMQAYLYALSHPSFYDNIKLLNGTYVKGKQWHPPKELRLYFNNIRMPSHSWPDSYRRAAITNKFRSWYVAHYKELFRLSDLEIDVLHTLHKLKRSTPHDLSHATQTQTHAGQG